MYDNFTDRAFLIIEEMKKLSFEKRITKLGSEFLLYTMYNIEDSLCHFLFNEYGIKKEELLTLTSKVTVLRKNDKEITTNLEEIFKRANLLALDNKISDEHLFMSILLNDKSIAYQMLKMLGLSIDDLILDVKEIYDFEQEKEMPYTKNLTKLAKSGKLNTFIDISNYIERMLVILKRKSKNNPILVGGAGVGKTALVEGLSNYIVNNNIDLEIISLNLGSLISGTKYRGDFEARLDTVIKDIIEKKNACLFIDEIHTIVGAGTTEGSLDVSNMIKPYLARGEFKVIGATTIDEYHKTIEKDKALNRRFESVFITEPSIKDTRKILYGIKNDYVSFHNVDISDEVIDYLIEISNSRIINRFRPDKCIDVLDEVLSYNKLNKKDSVDTKDIDNIIDIMQGFKYIDTDLTYKVLSKYSFYHRNNLIGNHVLLNLLYKGNTYGYKLLLKDLKSIFGITDEMVLDIDLKSFSEGHTISTLIGSPPGYIGYNDEGLLSMHIMKYPISVISLSNLKYASSRIINLFNEIKEKGFFFDRKQNKVICKNTIIIYKDYCNTNNVGFFDSKSKDEFDEIIDYNDEDILLYNEEIKRVLRKYDIEASILFDINESNKNDVLNIVYDLTLNKVKGPLNIIKNGSKIEYELNK